MTFRFASINYYQMRRGGLVMGLAAVLAVAAWLQGGETTVRAQTTSTTLCPGEILTIPNVEKELVPLGGQYGRPGDCVTPHKIVVHTTESSMTAQQTYEYFASGADGRGVDTHFIVGNDGQIIQTVEMLTNQVEVAYGVAGYRDHISIEMTDPGVYANKGEVPPAQYAATLNLVKTLMAIYDIPLGDKDCNWKAPSDTFTTDATPGIYGHYQLNPETRSDPGQQMLCDLRTDIQNGEGTAFTPGPGSTTTDSGGTFTNASGVYVQRRQTAYDGYARPYSWPMTGKVLQMYGFTDQAQSLGSRYPGLYPKGDPGVIFSKTNHNEPPPNAKNDKYLNPNIDIAPSSKDASARAVYSTMAGWLTYSGWAGEGKGYSIQVESDVDGDGQADYATRYMHLQPPSDGFFAPDVPFGVQEHPATPPAAVAPYVIEGEAMTVTQGQPVYAVNDSSSSNGRAMKMWGASTIAHTVSKRADRITVIAKGEQCLGAPEMVLKKDDKEFAKVLVTATQWANYTFDVTFDGASHKYSITFDNDLYAGCDRNLLIDATSFVVTDPNAPVTTTLSSTTIEAESLTGSGDHPPQVQNDVTASGKKYLAFYYGGKASGQVSLTSGNWLIVRAKGTQCNGSPHLNIHLDSASVLSLDVLDSDWTDYSTSVTVPATGNGLHTLTIEFTNDYSQVLPPCSRDVFVDSIVIQNNTTSQSTTNSSSLIGRTKYIGFNQLLGYVDSSRDTDHPQTADVTKIPDANQTYLSYRIMYNNPNQTTFPSPELADSFVNARVDNPYIIETPDNVVAGSLKDITNNPTALMYFFCAQRKTGEDVRCVYTPNPL